MYDASMFTVKRQRERERAYYAALSPAQKLARSRRNAKYSKRASIRRAQRKAAMATRPRPDVCECCGNPPTLTEWGSSPLCFDHDHVTGTFRGWLCRACNAAIGALGDDLPGVQRAVRYLENAALLT
jgi:Recombination endonuclease VII